MEDKMVYAKRLAYLEDNLRRHAHTVVGLKPLIPEINCGRCPVCIIVVYWQQNDVFRENVDLFRPFCKPTLFVSFLCEFRPKERVEVMDVQKSLLAG